MKVDIKILDVRLKQEEYAPKIASKGAAGVDLRACIEETLVLYPGEGKKIGAGFAVHIEDVGFFGLLCPRSSMGSKGIHLKNVIGIIDSDYQGEIGMNLINVSDIPVSIAPMERVAQLLIVACQQPSFNVVESFEASERGEGAFGSTGTK